MEQSGPDRLGGRAHVGVLGSGSGPVLDLYSVEPSFACAHFLLRERICISNVVSFALSYMMFNCTPWILSVESGLRRKEKLHTASVMPRNKSHAQH
jgi:hypothetical protein